MLDIFAPPKRVTDSNSGEDTVRLLREAPITFLWPTRSQRPRGARRARARSPSGQISKCPKNGPPETDFRGDRAGRGVPILVHFWDLTQIRQLMQSDPIILILCVHKKPKSITQRFAPPALRVLSSSCVLGFASSLIGLQFNSLFSWGFTEHLQSR